MQPFPFLNKSMWISSRRWKVECGVAAWKWSLMLCCKVILSEFNDKPLFKCNKKSIRTTDTIFCWNPNSFCFPGASHCHNNGVLEVSAYIAAGIQSHIPTGWFFLGWFTIRHSHGHRGLEPCLMCACCVTLWPQTVWRATVTESQGQGEGGTGLGSIWWMEGLPVWECRTQTVPDVYLRGGGVPCEPLPIHTSYSLSAPSHLCGPAGGNGDCWCLQSGGVTVPRPGRDTHLNNH